MNLELKNKIEKVDLSYKKRKEKYDKMEKRIWAGLGSEIDELTEIVSKEFEKVLKEIDLSAFSDYNKTVKRKVKINSFEVDYYAQFKYFNLKIKSWEVDVDGKPHSDREGNYGYCAYDYLEQILGVGNPIDPKIKKFKEDFNVSHIGYDCGCGSDHK